MFGDISHWASFGASVCGAAHQRHDLPNQDAIEFSPQMPGFLALSDGHGSSRCCRSERGARFAVSIAKRALLESAFPVEASLTTVKQWAEDSFPRHIVRAWREKVDDDLSADPLSDTECLSVGVTTTDTTPARLAYGATLLVVLATERFLLFMQLGDGDILVVQRDGTVDRPVARDPRLIGNETTSLCSDTAEQDFRIQFQPLVMDTPALILAATDGYANAFRDELSFRQVGTDLLQILREDGATVVQANLAQWLNEASASGSGDDITVGLLYRTDMLSQVDEDAQLTAADSYRSDR